VGFRVVLLLLAWETLANAQTSILSEAERKMFSGFATEEDVAISPKFTTRFGVRLTQGKVRYEEHFSTVDTDSDWDAWMTRGDLMTSLYLERDSGSDIGLEINFGVFRTTTEQENWHRDDTYSLSGQTLIITQQENDTDFNGWELKLAVGWLYDPDGPRQVKHLIVYGHRIIDFDRKDFVLTGTLGGAPYKSTNSTITGEEYTIDYLGYNPHFVLGAKEKWSLSFNPSVAYVIRNEAYNDYYKISIDGKGGIIASGEMLLGYQFTDEVTGYIGAMGEWQYLEGNTTTASGVNVEWPDNELFTYGGVIGLSFGL
jgi:hypothetical protein